VKQTRQSKQKNPPTIRLFYFR